METGCDIVKGVRIKFDDGTEKETVLRERYITKVNRNIDRRTRKKQALYRCFTYEHQTAIYRATLFISPDVRYGTTAKAQDTTFLFRVCHSTESIVTTDRPRYYYRKRRGAATDGYTPDKTLTELNALEERLECFKASPYDDAHGRYVARILQGYLSRYYYATQNTAISQPEQEEIHRRDTCIAEGFENEELLKNEFPEELVFLRYGHAIPVERKEGETVFRHGVEGWTEYFTRQIRKKEEWEYRGYTSSLVKALALDFLAFLQRENSVVSGLGFYKNRLSKLEKTDRKRIIRLIQRKLLSRAIRRIAEWV